VEICGLRFPSGYFEKHYLKRVKEGYLKVKEEYILIIKKTIKNADKFYIARQFSDCKDKLVFYSNNWSVWVLIEEERIITAFYVREKSMEDFFKNRNMINGLLGDCERESYIEVNKNENSRYARVIKTIQDRC